MASSSSPATYWQTSKLDPPPLHRFHFKFASTSEMHQRCFCGAVSPFSSLERERMPVARALSASDVCCVYSALHLLPFLLAAHLTACGSFPWLL